MTKPPQPPAFQDDSAPALPDWLTADDLPDAPLAGLDPFDSLPEPPETESPAVTPPPRAEFAEAMPAITPPPPKSPRAPRDRQAHAARFPSHADDSPGAKNVYLCGEVVAPAGCHWLGVTVRLPAPAGARAMRVSDRLKVENGVIEWSLGDLPPGQRVPLRMAVPRSAVGLAYVAARPPFEVVYGLRAAAQIVLTLAGPNRLRVGGAFALTATARNHGDAPAEDIELSVEATPGTAAVSPQRIARLDGGETASVVFLCHAPERDGPARWTVSARCGESAPVQATHPASVSTPIGLGATAPQAVELDSVEPFRVVVENPGTLARRDVRVAVTLPAELTFDSSDGVYSPEAGAVAWAIPALQPGERRGFTAWLRGNLPGPFRLTATATSDGDTVDAAATSECVFPRSHSSNSLAELLSEMDRLAGDGRPEAAAPAAPAGARHMLFRMGGTPYAVPLTGLLEVIRPPAVSPVPDAPAWFLGLANVRGEITSVVDFPLALGLEPGTGLRPVLVARSADRSVVVGLVVDEVLGIRRMRVSPWADEGGLDWGRVGEFVPGLGEDAGQLVPVIDLDRVFASDLLKLFESA